MFINVEEAPTIYDGHREYNRKSDLDYITQDKVDGLTKSNILNVLKRKPDFLKDNLELLKQMALDNKKRSWNGFRP